MKHRIKWVRNMRVVSVDMLEDNMVLARDIVYRESLVLRKGCNKINQHTQKLSKLGIKYLYIEDDDCNSHITTDEISEDTKKLCKKTLVNTMNALVNHRSLSLDEINCSIEHIIYDITTKNIRHSLTDIRTKDEYTFSHCISTTVYALLIGKKMKYSRHMLEQLTIGALLHDIGKMLLDTNILYKKETLSEMELQYVKQHVMKGYEYIKNSPDIPELSKNVILCHHERLDGSGYPNRLLENQLDPFSRIAGIADVYDALISDRCYRKKWKTNKALKFLLENSGTKFDADMVRVFMQNIAIFPNGSVIRLSDGRVALVKEQNSNLPLRPIIKVFADRWGQVTPIEEIDLMQVLSLTIVDLEMEIKAGTSWISVDI